MKLFLHVSSHFECEKLSKKIERKTLEFTWESSAIGPSPLFLPAALLFLSYFITMYLVWQIRNSMPSWRPGGRKLRCLSWCARSSPLRTERSGWVCESAACRPSLTEERVLSGWKKEKTNENSKRNNAKRQKKWLSRRLRKCIRIREGPSFTCFIACVASVSNRVIARKLERKHSFFALVLAF